ncbi:MAG: ribonuclease H-like domain-containing protein [Nitrospirota bacterium]
MCLAQENLKKELSKYKYLITFYGSVFDIPFLKVSMPDLKFDVPHFDICFGSKRIGFKGGLKRLETIFGIERHEAVRGLDGYDAVRLWERARMGSSETLELLTMYNKEDTVNLFKMADIIYQRLRLQTGIVEYL